MKFPFLDKLGERVGRVDKEELLHLLRGTTGEKIALESVLQSLADGILLLDSTGKILFVNRSTITLLNWGKKNPTGQEPEALGLDAALAEILSGTSLVASQAMHREVRVYYPKAMLLSVDMLPIRAAKGSLLGIGVQLRDITQVRRMEGRMLQSEKLGALSLLAAGIAHEVGNPLNSINIHLQLLGRELRKLKGSGKMHKLIGTVQDEIKRLDEIVHRFLTAIRPLSPRFEECDVNKVIGETLRLLRPELTRSAIQCETHLDDSIASTLLDPVHIRQALINLIKNAIQAMPKGGILKIFTGVQENNLVLRLCDTGAGIAPEHLSKIFDPYFTTRQEGSGLGLMMTQRIVREHGGEIEVKSARGKGTEFVLTFPIRSSRPKMITERSGMARAGKAA